MDCFTENSGHGADSDVPGNYVCLEQIKHLYLVMYPQDGPKLFHRNSLADLRADVAAHLGIDVDEIKPNRRVTPAGGDQKQQKAFAVLGRVLKPNAQALANAESQRVSPGSILEDLLAADSAQPLPHGLVERIQCRWLVSVGVEWKDSAQCRAWVDGLVEQLQAIPDTQPLSAGLRSRLKLADPWARCLADGTTTVSTPAFLPRPPPTVSERAAPGFPGDRPNVRPEARREFALRVAARDYARRHARTFGDGAGGDAGGDDDDGGGDDQNDGGDEDGGSEEEEEAERADEASEDDTEADAEAAAEAELDAEAQADRQSNQLNNSPATSTKRRCRWLRCQ